mgnify:CR=1 FL=1
MKVTLTVNGQPRAVDVEPRVSLVDALRDELRLTGTHIGCEHGVCGACTILFDGRPIRSCLMFAVQAHGHAVETVESLAGAPLLHVRRFLSEFGTAPAVCAASTRKSRPCSRAISRSSVAHNCRCGSPPAPPLVPIIIGMPLAIAPRNSRAMSRLIASGVVNGLPEPR